MRRVHRRCRLHRRPRLFELQRRKPALRLRPRRDDLSEALTGTAAEAAEADAASRGSAVKLAAEIAGRGLTLITTVVLARKLGVEDFGAFDAASAGAVLAAEAADLGLQSTASRALVAGTVSVGSLLRTKGVLTCLVVVGALLAGRGGLLATLVLYFTLAGWSELLGVALRSRSRPVHEAVVILVFRACGLLLVWPVLTLGMGLTTVAWAQVASTAFPIGLAAFLLARTAAGRVPESSAPVLSVLRMAFPLGVNAALALLSLRVERLALWTLAPAEETGHFAAALRLVEPLVLVPAAVVAGAMPALTREALRGDGPVRRRTALTIALVAVPATVGLVLVAPLVLALLFGREYAAAGPVLRLLALSLPAVFMNGMMFHALIAATRVSWVPRLTAVRLGVAVTMAFVLVPRAGALGAAVGFAAAEWVLFFLLTRACARASFPVPVAGPLVTAALLSVPMALVVWWLPGPVPVVIAAGVFAYAATVSAAWWARGRAA